MSELAKQLQNAGPLDLRAVADYERDGIILVTLPPEIEALRQALNEEMRVWLEQVADVKVDATRLPQEFMRMAQQDRKILGKLYKISRRFPAARRLSSHQWLVEASAQLMGTPLVSCCTFVNIRFDLPGEERYLTPIHQDFPYIQGSLNGVTLWMPLFDTPMELGPPEWIAGSHKWGVLKVREFTLTEVAGSGAKSFEAADRAAIEARAQFASAPVPAGTALLFSTLLVHRSRLNQSSDARINIQLRFDDALASESIQRNYPEGLYLGDSFGSSYPEYIA